jgi:hypothetical protein
MNLPAIVILNLFQDNAPSLVVPKQVRDDELLEFAH